MIKRGIVAMMIAVVMITTAVVYASPTYAAGCQKQDSFLGITTWYRGLQNGPGCSIAIPKSNGQSDFVKFVTMIALNILQAGLAAAAYVTIFFVIKGGFGYMTSAGSPDGMSSAKKTITNALIGLVIAVLSASIVNAIAGAIR